MDEDTRPWKVGSVAQLLESRRGQKWTPVIQDCIRYLNGHIVANSIRFQKIILQDPDSLELHKRDAPDSTAYIFQTTELEALPLREARAGTHHLVAALFLEEDESITIYLWHPAFI